MIGVRVATFSKYFGAGLAVASLCCARHCSWLSSQVSSELQEHYRSVARYADQAATLEASFMTPTSAHATTPVLPHTNRKT